MDWIEELVESWTREEPTVNFTSVPAMIRLARLGTLFEIFQHDVLEPFELTPGDYAVLAVLANHRRSGQPGALNPSLLHGRLRRSSGGMTKIMKRLERSELIERTRDPEDGRGMLVTMTDRGLALHDRVFRAFGAASSRMLAPLSSDEQAQLNHALKRTLDTLDAFEASDPVKRKAQSSTK
jgi:DNA-binding MarR family transcriptional regulator